MNETLLTVITVVGVIMAVVGFVGLIYYIGRYRKLRSQMDEGEGSDPDLPANTFASIWMINGFLHLGMLMLIIGGAGLIFYGTR